MKSSGVSSEGRLVTPSASTSTSFSSSDPSRYRVTVVSTSNGLWNQK